MTVARKQNLNGWRKYHGEWQFCVLFYTLESKTRKKGYMKSVGGTLREWEKQSGEQNLWGWLKSETERPYFFYISGCGSLIINFY